MTEEWKDLKDYEGFYQVSNLGRIKSMERTEITNNRWGRMVRKRKEFILKQSVNPNGYMSIELNKNGKVRRVTMHRLIYQTFVGELVENMCIHHKDHNKKNNCVENLKQIGYEEHNILHSHEAWNKGKTWNKKTIEKIQNKRNKTFLKRFKETKELYDKLSDKKKVADRLGINIETVYYRLKRYKEIMSVN